MTMALGKAREPDIRSRNLRARVQARAVNSIIAVSCLLAAACGSGTDQSDSAGGGISGFTATRTGAGVIAAGGKISTSQTECPRPAETGVAAENTIKIAYAGPDLTQLADIGLETIETDKNALIIDAYINALNSQGGLNDNCFELLTYEWDLSSQEATAEALTRICTEIPQHQPVILLTLTLYTVISDCIATQARIPILSLFATDYESTFSRSGERLFVDQGSYTYLLHSAITTAGLSGELKMGDKVGLLYRTPDPEGDQSAATAEETLQSIGLAVDAQVVIPSEFGGLGILLAEKNVRLLESGLSDREEQDVEETLAALSEDTRDLFDQISTFFLTHAAEFKKAGITAVLANTDWQDVRRFMRAAQQVDWYPKWIINDSQFALLVLTDTPKEQKNNLVQISTRRAAGDEIPELDEGCVSLRNTAINAEEAFSYTQHTDAWNLITTTCDYLDVIFAAVTRISGEINNESFLEELKETNYQTKNGSIIRFTSTDYYGNDRFRVLEADPNCVLNSWGCMRAKTQWSAPTEWPAPAPAASDTTGADST